LRALQAASADQLNPLMAMGEQAWSALRSALSDALGEGSAAESALRGCLLEQSSLIFTVPARIGDYTDFYTSIYHATNIGKQFRPDDPLLPNYRWIPIGYHGRASSIGVSGQQFRRPHGQLKAPDAPQPVLAPSQRVDLELELGIFIGPGNPDGKPIDIESAESTIFGVCLLNDWSARDIQAWEYQPLGPFLAKSFATTISPWIVTAEALRPFRVPFRRDPGEPEPLAYLDCEHNRTRGALDIRVRAGLQSAQMAGDGLPPATLCETSYRHAYWTAAQLVTHHSINGCNLQPGDLFGSGTLSGPTASEACAMMELTLSGRQPFALGNGEQRGFLEDGDTIVLHGWCEAEGYARIGFGECRGTVLPA